MCIAGNIDSWESLIRANIPLSSSMSIDGKLGEVLEAVAIYNSSDKKTDDLICFSESTEKIISEMPSPSLKSDYDESQLIEVRRLWYGAEALSEISDIESGRDICVSYFAMTLPWAINAIVRRLKDNGYVDESEVLEELALYSELGLNNMISVKLYLFGIKSRLASKELGGLIQETEDISSRAKVIQYLKDNEDFMSVFCSENTLKWIDVLLKEYSETTEKEKKARIMKKFLLNNVEPCDTIYDIRTYKDNDYLCSSDMEDIIEIKSTKSYQFDLVSNDMGILIHTNGKNWESEVINPELKITVR